MKSAQGLADQHVIKMVLETAQILSTALCVRDVTIPGLYAPTHHKHPCVVQATYDSAYYSWTLRHGFALADEYTRRFGKTHRSTRVLVKCAVRVTQTRSVPLSFALAMPERFKGPDPHEAYCKYLAYKYSAWTHEGKAPRWSGSSKMPIEFMP